MSAIFREIEIGWQGKTHIVKPTMSLLNRIEQKISLSRLAHSLANGEPKLSHVATAVAIMLQSANVEVTDEEIYVELMHGDKESVYGMAGAIVAAAFPNRPTSGNAASPNPKPRASKSKRQT